MAITLGPQHKSFPPRAWGMSGDAFVASEPTATQFQTPLLMLDRGAIDHNTTLMFDWLRDQGLAIAPHGKTTMAPALWQELLAAGAWGITFATAWQVQCARSFGVRRIMLANSLVDPVGLSWIADELAAHPDFEFVCWVDSVRSVERMSAILTRAAADAVADAAAGIPGTATGTRRPIQVIVELGAAGGRTGARTREEAEAIAAAAARSPQLLVAGVGGYEGALAHDRSASALTAIDDYLDSILELHRRFLVGGVYADRKPIVTAGGSAYFDRVATRLAPAVDNATVILRSGAFQIHDDGFYRGITPMGGLISGQPFRSAMRAWVRVISRPEPGLALFDAGKRDVPFDEGMPTVQHVVGLSDAESARILSGSTVSALND